MSAADIRPLRDIREKATLAHIRLALETFCDVGRAAIQLEVHTNTIRHYMRRAHITPEMVREWREEKLRQRSMEFQASNNKL